MKQIMNIAMFGHKKIPSREGGIEIVVKELTTRMASQGHKVVCYNREGHHIADAQYDVEEMDSFEGVKMKSVCTINKKGLAAMTSSFFAAVKVSFSDANIVHLHAEGSAFMSWIPQILNKIENSFMAP